jgi:hypothetical protein
VADRVEPKSGGLEDALRAGPAQERAEAHDQLRERERLRQVIVTARIEAGNPVDERIARGQEEDGRLHAAGTKRVAEIAAVRVRQADVDHQRVDLRSTDPRERVGAGSDSVDYEPLLQQSAAEEASQLCVVLDD